MFHQVCYLICPRIGNTVDRTDRHFKPRPPSSSVMGSAVCGVLDIGSSHAPSFLQTPSPPLASLCPQPPFLVVPLASPCLSRPHRTFFTPLLPDSANHPLAYPPTQPRFLATGTKGTVLMTAMLRRRTCLKKRRTRMGQSRRGRRGGIHRGSAPSRQNTQSRTRRATPSASPFSSSFTSKSFREGSCVGTYLHQMVVLVSGVVVVVPCPTPPPPFFSPRVPCFPCQTSLATLLDGRTDTCYRCVCTICS